MKKISLLLLAGLLAASLIACDKTPDTPAPETTVAGQTTVESTSGDESAPATESKPEATTSASESEAESAPTAENTTSAPTDESNPESAPADESGSVPGETQGEPESTDVTGESQTVAPDAPTVPSTIVLTFEGLSLSTSVADTGITVEGGAFVITRGGSYELKGDLSNGQIKVAVAKTEQVELIFNNFTASCNTSAPLYIESADKATIVLAAGSVNTLTDTALYQFANPGDDKPNACIYSSDDLTIKGEGTLNVIGKYNNGIGCKNDLRIKDCTLNVTGVNNIIKGNDSVEIENATVKLSGGEDGIKSDTTDRTDKGYILITEGSKVEIDCIDDAIQASVSITVSAGCTVTGNCGGDTLNCPGTINADEAAMQIVSATQP